MTASNPFKWRHYPGDIILWCVRWYLRFPISFAHMAEMALERGLLIHSSCIWRWVQIYGPVTTKRDAAAAKRFFRKMLLVPANPHPRVINVDKNRAYSAAVEELKIEGTLRRRCRLRQYGYMAGIRADKEPPAAR